ncbi:MAG: hypothetical protein AB7C91_08205 [Sphaerochaeta sp.]|uniref:hypothetical protein n=1 Tax=Sphaerochaeta sp. TaxID=1972642 RepID=UPI002FCADCC2
MRRLLFMLLFGIGILVSLGASDLLVLSDGSVHIGRILSYESKTGLRFEAPDGTKSEYPSSAVLATRTHIDVDNLIAQTLSPTYDMIIYHPRKKGGAYELAPRYTYRGQTYAVGTRWGEPTQVLEFFDMLRQQPLDEETSVLIEQLKTAMTKQNHIMQAGLITQLAGLSLLMVPYVASDEHADIPTWANWTGFSGIAVDLAGLGIMLSQLSVDHEAYLQRIADSFNNHLTAQPSLSASLEY